MKNEIQFIKGLYGLCKGSTEEKAACQFTFWTGTYLSCAYCPYGRMITAEKRHELTEEKR